MLIGVGVSYRILLLVICMYMQALADGLPRLGRGELIFFCYRLLVYGFCSEELPLVLGAWDRLYYFIVALPGPSI